MPDEHVPGLLSSPANCRQELKKVVNWTDLIIKRVLQTFDGPENNFNFEA